MSRMSVSFGGALGTKIIPSKVTTLGSVPIDEVEKWPYQAAQYGCQDLLAYSSYSDESGNVFIVDMNSMQLVQTLHGHRSSVTCVQWKPPPSSYVQHGLFLITGDRSGTVVIWDVAEGVILSSLCVPTANPVRILSLLTNQHLLVVLGDGSSFVYDSHLADREPIKDVNLPFRSQNGEAIVPLRMCFSKLCASLTSCVVLGDRIRIMGSLELVAKKSGRPWAKDLIYDSEDGYETVLDAAFSEAQEEVLYFATRNSVGAYDWKTSLLLNEQVLWHTKGDVEFRRLFPSFLSKLNENPQQLPLLYSFGTDQRLCAWFVPRTDKATNVAIDVRGARIATITVANVVQSESEANVFAVIFTDGSVARWHFLIESRRWSLEGYLSFALVKPTVLCVVGENMVSCALDTGHLVLIDVMHNITLRRVNIVHSGGTKIILLCPHKWGESVWVVTHKLAKGHHHHQVTLFDFPSGVVLRVLRKPTHPDTVRMKEISLSFDGVFLLLAYYTGTFEVWNLEEGGLIYYFDGMGVAAVAWAPQSFMNCLTGVRGTPQLLAVVFTDGAMSCWTVYKDHVTQNRDTASLLPSSGNSNVVCSSLSDALAVIDVTGLPGVVNSSPMGFRASRMKNVPHNVAALSIAVTMERTRSSDTETSSKGESLVAIVFDDDSFGVWNASSLERIGYSKNGSLNLSARAVKWIVDMLLVLTKSGDIAVVDKTVSTVNSSVFSKALRRPLQNSSFFIPAHRTYIQTGLELNATDNTTETRNMTKSTNVPSFLVQTIDLARRPCRGPFGQIITQDILTLTDELELYKKTMIPEHIFHSLQLATSQERREEVAFWVARILGQQEKQRFWAQFCASRPLTIRLKAQSVEGFDGDAVQGVINDSTPTAQKKSFPQLDPPISYLLGDRFSEAVAPSEVVHKNRIWFNELRILSLEAAKVHNVDDSKSRLTVARELLRLGEHQKSIDILMDSNYESGQFAHLANLAVTIAASTGAHDSSSSALFAATTRRAAAMLLAKGDVDGAVEKFILSGELYEAALALQSCGRWSEASAVAKEASMSVEHQKELLHRWGSHCAKRGELLEAARVFLSLASPGEALVLLSESPHLVDIAGLLAIILLKDYGFGKEYFFHLRTPSPSKDEDPSDALRLSEVVMNILTDYCGVLNSIGNFMGAEVVMEVITALKRGLRSPPSSTTAS